MRAKNKRKEKLQAAWREENQKRGTLYNTVLCDYIRKLHNIVARYLNTDHELQFTVYNSNCYMYDFIYQFFDYACRLVVTGL